MNDTATKRDRLWTDVGLLETARKDAEQRSLRFTAEALGRALTKLRTEIDNLPPELPKKLGAVIQHKGTKKLYVRTAVNQWVQAGACGPELVTYVDANFGNKWEEIK